MKKIRFWIAQTALRVATWAHPDMARIAMASVFIGQLRREGIVSIEFGFDDEGDPAMMVRRVSDLPIVTKH